MSSFNPNFLIKTNSFIEEEKKFFVTKFEVDVDGIFVENKECNKDWAASCTRWLAGLYCSGVLKN